MELTVGWVDACLLAGWLFSVLLGALRGLVFELLALGGWIAAYLGARAFAPLLAPHLPVGVIGSALNSGLAFVLAFIAVLIVWGLLAKLVRLLVQATPLRSGDRLLGAFFGALRGLVVLLVLTAAIGLTPIARMSAWRESGGVAMLDVVWQRLRPLLPFYLWPLLPAPPAA